MKDELSPRARAVIEAARDAHRPSPDSRRRVRAAIWARLDVVPQQNLSKPAVAAAAATGAKILGSVAVIGALVLGVVRVTRPPSPHASPTARPGVVVSPADAPAAPAIAPVPPSVATEPPPQVLRPRRQRLAAPPPAPVAELPPEPVATPAAAPAPPPRAPSTLEAETQLLREAELAMRAHDPALALGLLDAHAVQHAQGVLVPERRAARAIALCALGRADEGRREATRLLAEMPDSPLAERVRNACPGL